MTSKRKIRSKNFLERKQLKTHSIALSQIIERIQRIEKHLEIGPPLDPNAKCAKKHDAKPVLDEENWQWVCPTCVEEKKKLEDDAMQKLVDEDAKRKFKDGFKK